MRKLLLISFLLICSGCKEILQSGPIESYRIEVYSPNGELFKTFIVEDSFEPTVVYKQNGVRLDVAWNSCYYQAPIGWMIEVKNASTKEKK